MIEIEDLRKELNRLKKKLELYQFIENNLEDDYNEIIYRKKISKTECVIQDILLLIENLENNNSDKEEDELYERIV
jgi:hypothetical protein